MKSRFISYSALAIFALLSTAFPEVSLAERVISGTVTSEADGSPIEGARVTARDADSLTKDEVMGTAITDESGRYRIQYPKKNWDPDPFNQGLWRPDIFVTVDLRTGTKWLRVNRTPSSGDHSNHKVKYDIAINPKIKGPARITGIVRDAKGIPVANVSLKAFDADPGQEDLMGETKSKADGTYEITYARKKWDPYPHESGLWRPDIFLRAKSSDGTQTGTSDIFTNHRVAEDLVANVTIKPKPVKKPDETTTCDGKPRGTNTKLWTVVVINPVTSCNMPVYYLADSEDIAMSCASEDGFQVATLQCEYLVVVYSNDGQLCTDSRLYSNSGTNAQTCARMGICENCNVQDITNAVTPFRVPPSCVGGFDWGLVNSKLLEICKRPTP